MDYSETAIWEMIKKKSVVSKKEVFTVLKNTPKEDVEEALLSLEKQGFIVKVSLMGQDSYSLKKQS